MALFGAILSGMKKKDEEEKNLVQAPAPTAQASAQLASPAPQGGGFFGKAKTGIQNFFAPSPDGVRARDVVREIPGAAYQVGTQYFTQPVARGIQTLVNTTERAIGAGDGVTTPQEIAQAVPNKTARDIIYGDQPITSLQEITERRSPDVANAMRGVGINNQLADKTAPGITFLGAAGLTVADALPGDPSDLVKGGGKAVLKETAEAGGKEALERVAINSVDDLAPYLKSLLPQFKGNLDEALAKASTALDIPESVVKELKSGKVIDSDNFVFQFNKKAGNFVANFEKKLQALPLPEIQQKVVETAKQTLDETAKPILETATKAKTAATETIEQVADTAKETIDEVTSFADDITGRKKFSELTDDAAEVLDDIANDEGFKTLVEKTKGAPVTADEVRQAALNIQDTLGKATGRSQTVEEIAKSTNSFDEADRLMNEGGAPEEIAKLLNEGLSFLTDAARKLQSGNQVSRPDSIVGDPLIKEIYQRTGNITAEIVDKYRTVDKTNPKEVRDFYYTYAKPTLMEVIDEYRYINILSSPKTQLRNINANLIDSIITEPGTKLMRGFVDQVKSVITKQPRQHFSREATAYYKGFFSAGKEAVDNVKAVMQGNRFIGNPDLKAMPIGKYATPTLEEAYKGIRLPGSETAARVSGQALEVGTNVNKALEAMDVFFTTLIRRGEEAAQTYRQSRGVELTQEFIEAEAKRMGEEVALRTALDPTNETGQGLVATGIDQVVSWLGQTRNSPYKAISNTAKVIFPFLRTTANYMTRFLEYTPGLGMLNAVGRKNVDELIARQAFGSTVLAGTMMYAFRAGAEDNMTWDAPTSEKEKNLFYDSGRRPYSIKLGNQWVGYQQLGMLGAPLALTAALKHQLEQDKDVSEPMMQSVARAYASMLPYFGDMSFARSFGNLGDAMKGEQGAVLKLINEPFRQAVPLAGMQGWAKAMLDPIYRKSEPNDPYSATGVVLTAFAPTLKNLPFLSQLYEPYTDTLGNPSTIDKPLLNAISPISVSGHSELFDFAYQRKRLEGQVNKLKRDFEDGKINAGGVEQGVNTVMDNFVRFVGGDPSQMGDFTLPEQVERGLRVPKEEPTPINLTPEQEKQLAESIPQIKQEMLAAITATRAALNTPSRGVSVRASARKVPAPKSSSRIRGIALKASTPTRSRASGVRLRPPGISQTTDLASSMPELPRLG